MNIVNYVAATRFAAVSVTADEPKKTCSGAAVPGTFSAPTGLVYDAGGGLWPWRGPQTVRNSPWEIGAMAACGDTDWEKCDEH